MPPKLRRETAVTKGEGKRFRFRTRTASQALTSKIKNIVDRSTETKELFFNSGTSSLNFTKAGDVMPLFASGTVLTDTYYPCAQGDGDNERIGDTVKLKYLKLNIRLTVSTISPDVVRVIVFRWKPNIAYSTDFNTLTPLILYNVANDDYQTAMSHYNNKKGQYHIYRDRLIHLDTYNSIKAIRMKIPLKDIKCEFTGDGTSTTHSMTNSIFVMVIGEGTPTNVDYHIAPEDAKLTDPDEDSLISDLDPFEIVEPDKDGLKHFAVTVNICPTKKMNNKLWRTYTHDKQRDVLLRVEGAFRRKTPSVELKEIRFEECPTLKQIHYHAHYVMPKEFEYEMFNHFKRICCSQDEHTLKPWRFIAIKELPRDADVTRWEDYIRKDAKK